MMIQNKKGNIFILSLAVVIAVVGGGIILMSAFSRKTDFISKYERTSGGQSRLEEEIKYIEPFRYDWLNSQRTSAYSRTIINQCIPKQTDFAPQNFANCPKGTLLSDGINEDLLKNYSKQTSNTLSTITANSYVVTLPLVDVGDRPIAGTQSNPALFDEAGLPCQKNCYYSVAGYMLKENPTNMPGNLVFAFKIADIGSAKGMLKKKDSWLFIPILTEHWNRMPLNLAAATNLCPKGSFAVGFLPNRKVICRDHNLECMDGQYLKGMDKSGNGVCAQLPIFQEPSPSLSKVNCDSWGFSYTKCNYTIPDPNMTLGGMTVNYQRSRTTCAFGVNFGYSTNPTYVWSDTGCRAQFNLEFFCNADYYLDYAANVCRLVDIGQYSPPLNNGTYTCTNNPPNSIFTGRGGGANNCPWACGGGYYKTGSTCSFVGTGFYSPALDDNRYPCTTAPANAHYTDTGMSTNSCPWACNSGYNRVGASCVQPPPPAPSPSPGASPSPSPTP